MKLFVYRNGHASTDPFIAVDENGYVMGYAMTMQETIKEGAQCAAYHNRSKATIVLMTDAKGNDEKLFQTALKLCDSLIEKKQDCSKLDQFRTANPLEVQSILQRVADGRRRKSAG